MFELLIEYDALNARVVFRAHREASSTRWYAQLRRVLEEQKGSAAELTVGTLTVDWRQFSKIREGIGAILRSAGVRYEVSVPAALLLRRARDRKSIFNATSFLVQPSERAILERLARLGWQRTLTPEQMRNVRRLEPLPASATFSVPGAGKTTEALACFFLKATSTEGLLVVAPKNAFGAWDEQLVLCMGEKAGSFARLRGGSQNISAALANNPRMMLITYQQLARVSNVIAQYIALHDTYVFLDESHKIKSGRGNVTPDAILMMSHLPIGKLILSGTPMPQSPSDLVPQFEFLYPEVAVTPEDVIAQFQPIYVRTHKGELKLPPVLRHTIPIPFNPAQKCLHDLMRSEVVRQAEQALNQCSRTALRALGRSVMRMLEVVSNPSLLARDIGFLHDDLLGEVLSEGAAPKIQFACERARRLAKKGQKVIIWTTFRQNVESIADQLRDLNAVYIHGGIDAGDQDDGDTREGRIKQFRNDPNCFVMVANPAAAAEGISLHKICRHAIYVDRTYNAAHYLQSEDRIHRLGLGADESPNVEILFCPGSLDESVHARLVAKVAAMATALNDPSLSISANQYIPFDVDDDPESESEEIDEDDVRSILQWLRRKE